MSQSARAVRFDRRMGSGRTKPSLLAAMAADGTEVEVVTKFSAGCDRSIGALAVETISALLAADLDLPVPEFFFVTFDEQFVATISDQEAAELARKSDPVAFGSKKLPPGFSVWPSRKAIPALVVQEAAEIFAFDALTCNADRRPANPNCLFDGKSLAMFDHELCFVKHIGWRGPWEEGALDFLRVPTSHLFTDQLRGKTLDFSRFVGAWQAISDRRLVAYRDSLPSTWQAEAATNESLTMIKDVRDNIQGCAQELRRVLA